ncbi:MAG: DUF6455 family protein [Pseudorhodoplanes sp.]|jgi:hypothetical protein|nr:DUF6455 family protein [Pseudorhodoplanes sp.]
MTELAIDRPGLFQSIVEAFQRFQKRQTKRAEIAALGTVETKLVAQDVGLTESDLVALTAEDEDSASLMERRLADCGVDIKSVNPILLRDMQRCCSQCNSKRRCAYELDKKPKAAAWPSYCPNEQTMAALAAAKCH